MLKMLGSENNITYDNVDSYILEKIPGFSEFFYQTYDDSDREMKFEVFGSLTEFFKESYKRNDESIVNLIIDELYKIYNVRNEKLQDLILTGFIENLLDPDRGAMINLRENLKYLELQKCLDELYMAWYGKSL